MVISNWVLLQTFLTTQDERNEDGVICVEDTSSTEIMLCTILVIQLLYRWKRSSCPCWGKFSDFSYLVIMRVLENLITGFSSQGRTRLRASFVDKETRNLATL